MAELTDDGVMTTAHTWEPFTLVIAPQTVDPELTVKLLLMLVPTMTLLVALTTVFAVTGALNVVVAFVAFTTSVGLLFMSTCAVPLSVSVPATVTAAFARTAL